MKLTQIVVIIAWAMFATAATAESTTQATQSPTNVNVTVNTSASDSDAQAAQPAAPAAAAPVVAAPATAAPTPSDAVVDKKAEALRKVRQDVELKNDNKVVEKLEKTRLDEEKQLAKKVDNLNLKPTDAPAQAPADAPTIKIEKVEVVQQPAPAPAPTAAPAPTPAPEAAKTEEKPAEDKKVWYAAIDTGAIIYSGNIQQKSNLGVMVGKSLDDHMVVEGSLTYSTFSLNNFWTGVYNNLVFGDVDQYDLAVAVKYSLFDSAKFRPYVGGAADYLYRQYKDSYNYYNSASQATNALNASLLAGVDFQITSRLSIGGEFKYSMPIYYQDNGYVTASYLEAAAKPLEQTTFTSWLLDVKFSF